MDADAYVQAVHDHKDRVHSYAAWVVRDLDEAADLTQETYMRLWQHHQGVEQAAARTWLLRTVSRLVIDRSRKMRPDLAPSGVLEYMLGSDQPDEPVLGAESRDQLARAITELPERDQALLHLCHVQGLSSHDVGAVLDMNDGAVRVALARARRKVLEALCPTEGAIA